MAVFRVHKNDNYTVMSNRHFKERGMTLKSKGLLSLMLSLPEDWDYSAAGLVTLSKDGKDGVNAALKELEKFGYLRRTQVQGENGKFSGYDYEIFESPITENPSTELPFTEKPSTVKPITENPQQLNTNQLNTKKLSTEVIKKERKKPASGAGYDAIISESGLLAEVQATLYEFIKMRKFIKKPMTDFALKKLVSKLKGIAGDPSVQIKVLEKSILNNWQDIFPPKAEQTAQRGGPAQKGILEQYEEMNIILESSGDLF